MSNATSITRDLSGNAFLDPTFANLLAAAAAAAYTDFANTNNPGYTPPALIFDGIGFNFLQRFTGFDDVIWGSGEEERYALLYQSASQNNTYLIAFRGTSSVDDMLLDLESGSSLAFIPFYNSSNFPKNVYVGDGFNKIYLTQKNTMPASLQKQIFTALGKLPDPPTEIFITGHSLGGALASLFTLDMAVSLPDVGITSITFASPRVGSSNWQTVYDQTYHLQDKTIRVRNSYDLVPKAPPANWPFSFKDIGQEFLVSFNVENNHIEVSDIILSWHALTNYTYVVTRAVTVTPQLWTGEFPDQTHNGWNMLSYNPDAASSALEQANSRDDVKQLLEKQNTTPTVAV
ncbi:lipase family protein [Cellvibrio mixtus]|uniref:lipase family protein n=1 Tax=Cellvibrio mixtus TaxID=39650 RepID=UPI00058762BC|nr:lipase family protein [Cellvibrio mixtus]